MYIYYIKYQDSVFVQNNTDYEMFNNTNNLEKVLKTNNRIEIINMRKEDLKNISDSEEVYLKTIYLNLKEEFEKNRLNKLIDNSVNIYSDKKVNGYIENNSFIGDLDNKLKLIEFYLEIKNTIKNHQELNIIFNDKENNSKKLKFINLCLTNIDDPDNFVNELIKNDKYYSINKQKKLKYNN